MKRRLLRVVTICGVLLAGSMLWPPAAAHANPRRILHVSLYPFIPEPEAAALTLKQGFEALHPDVILDVNLNWNYYSLDPRDKGVLFENADIHEIDVVFMRDFLDRRKLQPAGVTGLDRFEPLALQAATAGGVLWAVPHWMCTDFLIYRADKTGLADAHSLAALEQQLGPEHGLLLDMKGEGTLGELYLSSLLASDRQNPDRVLAHLASVPKPEIVQRMRRLVALEPAGLGRRLAYDATESFYARQFARRVGSAFVGYSEMTHEVLDETAKSCRIEDRCVTAAQIRVAAFPFADGHVRPMVWVDSFAIDARVHGQKLADARDFLRYAVSLPAYQSLLIPPQGDAPRTLLPATEAAFDDPQIRHAVPLYAAFRAIAEQGVVVAAPHLTADLHEVASRLDTDLPQIH